MSTAFMTWDTARASEQRAQQVAAFIDAQAFVGWRIGRRLAVAGGVLLVAQVLPGLLVLATWNGDRLGGLVILATVDAILVGGALWFASRPRSFARMLASVQHPPVVDPKKWNPWLGGGA